MPKRKKSTVAILFALALSLVAIACQRLETGRFAAPRAPLPFKVLDPVPLDYGELVAATPYAEDAHWTVLWFQKADKTISAVYVNVSQGKVRLRAEIPRK